MNSPPVSVVLAMDDAMARRELRLQLHSRRGIAVVAEAASSAAGGRMAETHHACVLVLDCDGGKGLPLAIISDVQRSSRVIVLTDEQDPAAISDAFRAGAVGYVLKGGARDELARAVLGAARDDLYLTPGLGARLGALPVRGDVAGQAHVLPRSGRALTTHGPLA